MGVLDLAKRTVMITGMFNSCFQICLYLVFGGYSTYLPIPAIPYQAPTLTPTKGGCSGLGLEIVKYFAQYHSHIHIIDLNAERGASIATGLAKQYPSAIFHFHIADVTSWDAQAAIFKRVHAKERKIDYVFANAGIARDDFYVMEDTEGEPVRPNLKTIDVNLNACLYSAFSSSISLFLPLPIRRLYSGER
jgi:short-subunit dehydrogenase involved in D-alanine esterification of teichoic acids